MEEYRFTAGLDGIEDAYAVRIPVFVEEQGFSPELEKDEIDCRAEHLVVFREERPVATGRLFFQDGGWHIGRVAVLADCRGTGVGRRLMEKLEERAAQLGGGKIRLSAQTQASGFYESLGYHDCGGGEYLDEHCPHTAMEKTVTPTEPDNA